MLTRPLRPEGPFGQFAERLLEIELPGLPVDRRADAVAFTCRRADQMPSPLRLGLSALSIGVGVSVRIVGPDSTTRWLRHTTLPMVGELARMVRSLAFTFVWETWPSTAFDGAPAHRAAL